jgi:uncharacterized membrane protein YdjX (TVP38/TMEM64 family)
MSLDPSVDPTDRTRRLTVTSPQPTPTRLENWKRLIGGVLLLATLLILGRILPVGPWLERASTQLRHAGIGGALVFILGYSLGALLFVPSAIFTFVAGFTFGAWWGTLIGIPGIATSSFAVFFLSQTLLRKPVQAWLLQDPRWFAVDRLLAKFGARSVVLLRLSPLSPFSVMNYAFGLTGIPRGQYFLATCIGTIPGSVFYAQLGAVAPRLGRIAEGRLPEGGRLSTVFLLVGLVLTAVVGLWLGIGAKRAIRSAQSSDGIPSEGRNP